MEVSGQRHAPAALPPERSGTHFIGGWVGLRACLNRCGKSRHPPGFFFFFYITMTLLTLVQFVQCLVYAAVLTTLDLS